MANRYDDEKFGDVVRDYVRGRISRRQFIVRGAQLGLSAAVLAKLTRPSRAAANLIDSDPVAPYESPDHAGARGVPQDQALQGHHHQRDGPEGDRRRRPEVSRAALGGGRPAAR